ncbi:DUF262 domain-containing protein [Gordonia sp. (in: high G+C Gram-positive bacteria)]|uniref:DUF262 domain-containing protein n=1 Tax=Gordonia sp. (in: high G+C Gram-positive bacteria) TaxID=84139 RepID=UPI003529AB53
MSVTLNTAPKTEVFDVEELVAKAWNGEVRIPSFQRPLRWGFEDARRLIDSILRGYPVGNLLLWARPATAERVRLGVLTVEAPELATALWVVDGQQRVTTLANVFSPKGSRDERFGLSVDLTDEQVVRTRERAPSHVVPLPVLFDLQELMRWFRDHPEVNEYFDVATGVAKRMRSARIAASVVTTTDEAVLREIFDRVNNYGKKLKRAEVFAALNPTDPADDESSTLTAIAESINIDDNFGVLDVDTVMKALLARRGPDIARDIRQEFTGSRLEESEFPGEDARTAHQLGAVALKRAVHFLQREADIPHTAFLPYKYLLVVLTRVFGHHSMSEPSQRRLLKRWLWRAAAAGPGVFPGSTTGAARALCGRVDVDDPDRTLVGLIDAIPENRLEVPDVRSFRTNHATGKTIACAMWSLHPRALDTGLPLGTTQLAAALEDAQTPRDAFVAIVGRGPLPDSLANSAGRWLLAPGAEPAMDHTVEALVARAEEPEILASHCLTESTVAELANAQQEDFVEARGVALQQMVDDFLQRRWELGFESRPPLARFVFDDPEEPADD